MDLGELLGTLHSQAAPSMAEENNFDDELSDGSSQLTDEETVVDDDSDGGSDLVRALTAHVFRALCTRVPSVQRSGVILCTPFPPRCRLVSRISALVMAQGPFAAHSFLLPSTHIFPHSLMEQAPPTGKAIL